MDELNALLLRENPEGTYAGLSRALKSWMLEEKRLRVFLRIYAYESKLNETGDKIEAVRAISNSEGKSYLFFAKYFIDCSGVGSLSELCGAPGEKGKDLNEYDSKSKQASSRRDSIVTSIQVPKRKQFHSLVPIGFGCNGKKTYWQLEFNG